LPKLSWMWTGFKDVRTCHWGVKKQVRSRFHELARTVFQFEVR
jgi:hypothetical protein